jgi:hypothetical protein
MVPRMVAPTITAEHLLAMARRALPEALEELEARNARFSDHVFVIHNVALAPGTDVLIQKLVARGVTLASAQREARKQIAAAARAGLPFTASGMHDCNELAETLSAGPGAESLVAWLREPVPLDYFKIVAFNGPDALWELVKIRSGSAPN